MEWVDIEHPKTGGRHRAPKSALGHWLGIGWRVAEEEPQPEPEPVLTSEVSTEETTESPVRSRKRRATESEEE